MTAALETARMTPHDWAAVPGNPRQRNTEDRVKRAKHLFTVVEDHRVVKAAVLPNGDWIKIDGHTRALFWQRHPELAPADLLVVLYRCSGIEEALELYDACDNAAALETGADKVYGAFRELEYQPASALLQVGKIAAAMRQAYALELHVRTTETSVHVMVRHWLPELRWIDALAPQPLWFSGPVLIAALLTLRKHNVTEIADGKVDGNELRRPLSGRGHHVYPAKVREFWERYSRNEGTKEGREIDAIETLRHIVDQQRRAHHLRSNVSIIAAKAVACVERYLLGRRYRATAAGEPKVPGTDLAKYFPPAKPPHG